MRHIGPKNRIARKEGIDLGLKTPGTKTHANLLKKINIPPGQHGTSRRRKVSERGKQLHETQKLKYIFGTNMGQMKGYFKKAVKKTGNTGLFLSQFLEKRLDNIVFRLGFAPTRASARQLVNHGHIKVNDKKVSIASYQVKSSDIISFLDEKSIKIPAIEKSLSNKEMILPSWLEKKGIVGKVTSEPTSDLIEKQILLRLVIEYFSR
ncbi:30S ribosomal protein S4 [Candidatus Roizmanbacteria bacterium CG_4_10_14_0_8_um_filter_33_9]|uniref:Small ribosomal subunit protein uS4 n=1 Tax=Candidatus Roizmanbacteria bacterium CG_4_10_14_0_8_um_filter_33_9 TaxID=1974826 RepID=A0A2M7QIQ6_9BACT|nr:MAG: 30S ribosomal protein S4 [Candidatus Roizmanbacteria bacterium CG_4_10_14_0_8_um_filter_33_9]